jgi:RNA polymerase sigma-70 factor (sigma-E family)
VNAEDEAAFGSYVTARLPALLRLAHLLTGSAHEADDLVQNALVRTCRAWPRIRNQGDPDAYVRRVMVNARNSWWSRRRPESSTDLLPERAAAPGLDFDERDRMWQALATLPRKQRAVLVLRYYEDLSETEIAEALGCSAGTVKSQAHKALGKLRALPEFAAETSPPPPTFTALSTKRGPEA